MATRNKLIGAVAAIALVLTTIVTFAFKTEVTEKRVVTKVYYHVGDMYTTTAPSPTLYSCQEDDFYCTITYAAPDEESLPVESTFDESSIPDEGPGVTRSLINAEASWKLKL